MDVYIKRTNRAGLVITKPWPFSVTSLPSLAFSSSKSMDIRTVLRPKLVPVRWNHTIAKRNLNRYQRVQLPNLKANGMPIMKRLLVETTDEYHFSSDLVLRSHRSLLVKIESKTPLKGIFIQGRELNASEPIGTFIHLPDETQLVKCSSVRIEKSWNLSNAQRTGSSRYVGRWHHTQVTTTMEKAGSDLAKASVDGEQQNDSILVMIDTRSVSEMKSFGCDFFRATVLVDFKTFWILQSGEKLSVE